MFTITKRMLVISFIALGFLVGAFELGRSVGYRQLQDDLGNEILFSSNQEYKKLFSELGEVETDLLYARSMNVTLINIDQAKGIGYWPTELCQLRNKYGLDNPASGSPSDGRDNLVSYLRRNKELLQRKIDQIKMEILATNSNKKS